MKVSDDTITILKNFQGICNSILIKPGSILRTGTIQDTMQATAIIKENFEQEFAIYDIAKFLSVLSLFKDPDLEFTKSQIVIRSGVQSVNYTYAAPNMVYYPVAEPKPKNHLEFQISAEALSGTYKALSVLQQKELAVVCNSEGEISLETLNSKDSGSDFYRVVIAKDETCQYQFRAVIKQENMKVLPKDYTVRQDMRGMTVFSNDELTYFVANELTSKLPKV